MLSLSSKLVVIIIVTVAIITNAVVIMIVKIVVIIFSITRLRAAVWSLLGTQPSKDCTAVALKRPRYIIIISILNLVLIAIMIG